MAVLVAVVMVSVRGGDGVSGGCGSGSMQPSICSSHLVIEQCVRNVRDSTLVLSYPLRDVVLVVLLAQGCQRAGVFL